MMRGWGWVGGFGVGKKGMEERERSRRWWLHGAWSEGEPRAKITTDRGRGERDDGRVGMGGGVGGGWAGRRSGVESLD